MKISLRYLVMATLMVLFIAIPIHTYSQVIDIDDEILVYFLPDSLEMEDGFTEVSDMNKLEIKSKSLDKAMKKIELKSVKKAFPDFAETDTVKIRENGKKIKLPNMSRIYVLKLKKKDDIERVINELSREYSVLFAEKNGRGEADFAPNDTHYNYQWFLDNDGTYAQGSGSASADIRAEQAWDITTGSSSIKIAIVDAGMQTNHPDFTGRVSGDSGDNADHGTAVAGIAAAAGNNSQGVAGVAWNVGIINEDYGSGSFTDFANAVISASNRGAHVINNSWKLIPVGTYSTTVRMAFASVYKQNKVSVASMGNQYGEVIQYPAAFGQGILTVGATTNTDVHANYSSTGSYIDVCAPGGGGFSTNQTNDYMKSTIPGSGYGHYIYGNIPIAGTSFSAPVVTGIASLLKGYNTNLDNDDIEQIIRLSADKVSGMNGDDFTDYYGTGRVNAKKALDLLREPYVLEHNTTTGGNVVNTSEEYTAIFFGVSGLADGLYIVKKYMVQKTVPANQSLIDKKAWGRGVSTNGFSAANPNYGMGYCEIVNADYASVTVRTYIYQVWNIAGTYLGYYPTTASNVEFAYSILGEEEPEENCGDCHDLGKSGSYANERNGKCTRSITIPQTHDLSQNFPNPFNPSTTISYELPESGQVSIEIYNIKGMLVKTLVDGFRDAGSYSVKFLPEKLSSGIYFYKIQSGSFTDIKRMAYIK